MNKRKVNNNILQVRACGTSDRFSAAIVVNSSRDRSCSISQFHRTKCLDNVLIERPFAAEIIYHTFKNFPFKMI